MTGPRSPSPPARWPRCWTSTGTWSATCGWRTGGGAPAVAGVPGRGGVAGSPVQPRAGGRAADAELAEARPLRHNGFKLPLTRAITVRALTDLANEAAS
ncbi:hypothetical protein NKG94_11310 [Micromonospora sp. M12]